MTVLSEFGRLKIDGVDEYGRIIYTRLNEYGRILPQIILLSITDGFKPGDSTSPIGMLSFADGIELGDVTSILSQLLLDDGLELGDSPLLEALLSVTDGFELGDTVATLWVLLALTEGMKIGGTPLLSAHIQASDGVVMGDSISQEMLVNFLLTDVMKFGDANLLELVSEAIHVAVTDGIKVGDATILALEIAISDGIKVGDAPALAMAAALSLLEGIKLGDTTYVGELRRLLRAWIFTETYHNAKVYTEPCHEATVFTEPYHCVTIWTGEEDMTLRRDWQRPETVPIWAEVKVGGDLANPTESILLTLTNPDGDVEVGNISVVASASFTVGLLVTGGTSGATGVVWEKPDGTTLHLQQVTGTWVSGEAITDAGSGTSTTSSVLAAVSMTNISTGLYVYYWNSVAASVVGWHKAKGHFQDGTVADARITIEYGGFFLQ